MPTRSRTDPTSSVARLRRFNPSELSRRTQHLLAFVVLALIIGGLYLPVLAGHASVLTNGPWPTGPLYVVDPVAGGQAVTPLQHLVALSWTHRVLPVFDPYQAYGIPLLANQGEAVYLPEILLHLLFPANYSIWNVVNLLVMAYGAYLLAVSIGQPLFAGLAVGVASVLAGVAPPNVNMGMLNPLAILPFVLLSLRYVLDPESHYRRTAALGLVTNIALLSLSGFAEVLPLLAVVIIVFTFALLIHFKTFQRAPRRILTGIAAAVAGLLIGSVGTFPVIATLRQGFGANPPTSYLEHVSSFWLSTLTIPSLTGKAVTASPSDLGQSIWTLGTPVLIVVLASAIFITLHRDANGVRWYVWPSGIMVIFGILGYADLFNTLNIFFFFPFTSIAMIRFLQFAWWLPWCLLLGAVISKCHLLRWYEVLVALLAALLFDLAFLTKFQDAQVAAGLSHLRSSTWKAFFVALGILIVFSFFAFFAQQFRLSAFMMLGIVVVSCIYYLPTNFFSAADGQAVTSVRFPDNDFTHGTYLDDSPGTIQLATTGFSVQLFTALGGASYAKVMPSLLPAADMVNDVSTVFEAGPWMYYAVLNSHFVQILEELGTNVITSPTPLPTSTFGPIPQCGGSSSPEVNSEMCFLGYGENQGSETHARLFVYSVIGAQPLFDPVTHVVAVPTSRAGTDDTLRSISAAGGNLTGTAYVTMTAGAQPAARGVVGLRRTATAQTVRVSLRSKTRGMVVLRETYEVGMSASMNGASVPVFPVDGGLWTAVVIPSGRSTVVLDYATQQDVIEFYVAGIGLICLILVWCALGVARVRRRTSH